MPVIPDDEMPDYLKVLVLRKALQELVDRRREVTKRVGQAFEGSDLRYKRAQEALDLTK